MEGGEDKTLYDIGGCVDKHLKEIVMKKLHTIVKCCLALGLALMSVVTPAPLNAETTNANADRLQRYLIPKPLSYFKKEGSFTVNENTKIVLKSVNAEKLNEVRANIATPLQTKVRTASNLNLAITEETTNTDNVITIELMSDETLGTEGYKLNVTSTNILLAANECAGLFRGLQTLRQLFPEQIEDTYDASKPVVWELPNCEISDKPEYEYRSTQLDLSRHFFNKEEIMRQIDLASQYKLNTYHLHLGDDQGWRLEIKGELYGEPLSKLTSIGGSTSCTTNGKKPGFLTQDEFKEIVAYANARYVQIIPEFDMPAHAWAALVSLNFLNSTEDGKPHVQGYDNTKPYEGQAVGWASLECRNPKTLAFVDEVFKQVSAISPSKYIHIGGDEAHVTSHDDYVYFVNEVSKIAKKYGKTPIGWQKFDEIMQDKQNDICQFWGTGGQRLRGDVKYVVAKADRTYLDMKYDAGSSFGLSWAGYIPIRTSYEWDPTDVGRRDQILGVEAPLWCETVATQDAIDYLVYPRLIGLAEVAWTPKNQRSWNEYKPRLIAQDHRLEAQGVKYYKDPEIWTPELVVEDDVFRFEEASGTKITSENKVYTGDLTNTTWSEGKVGKALTFNGTGIARLNASQQYPEWTISTWINKGHNTGDNAVLAGGTTGDIKLEQYPNKKQLGVTKYGVTDSTFTYEVPENQWIYLSFVGDSTGVTLFVNGEKLQHLNVVIPCPNKTIGATANDGLKTNGNMVAKIDNYHIFSSALSDAEIAALYQEEIGGELKPAKQFYFKFNENTGNEAISEENAGKGTLTNTKWVKGVEGSGLSFDKNASALLTNIDVTDNWTISTWINRGTCNMDNAILAGGPNEDLKLEQWQNTKKLGVTKYRVADNTFDYEVPKGKWTYITFVGNSTGVTLYVNGVKNSHINLSIPCPKNTIGAAFKEDLENAGNMTAIVDNYRIIDQSLNAKEVKALYDEEASSIQLNSANYEAVEAALASVPKNLNIYTAESVARVNEAVAAVRYDLPKEQQAEVDAMATAITTAVSQLEYKPADQLPKAIFSIDAGRKYFSKDQIIDIIRNAAEYGYTDVQLILGNDGLRFVLDDMQLTVNGTVYESDRVIAAIKQGNNKYYNDPNGNALTESEMDEILAYAAKRNIGIIPVINSPGHMDAMLDAMIILGIENPKYMNSVRTVDLNNAQAIGFNKALIEKYAAYFSKYSKIFNFGADEYANDVNPSGTYSNGFARLQGTGMYPKFVEYVNSIAAIIKENGMSPMCFNDGIYYDSKDTYGTFDQDIIISYWTSGWGGYDVATASYLHNKGHKIINTNDGWYWVLGRISSGGYPYNSAIRNIQAKDFTSITGDNGSTPSIGSMECVWCDTPSAAHDFNRIYTLMDTFSTKHADYMIRQANYDAVEAAIASVPADLSGYTKASVEALNQAIANVEWSLKLHQQAQVNEMATAIQEAVANLEAIRIEISSYSLSMASNIDVNLYLTIAEEIRNDQAAKVTFTREDGTSVESLVKDLNTYQYKGKTYYTISVPMVARMMNDTIAAKATLGNGEEIALSSSSVKGYAQALLANPEKYGIKAINAVKAMVNYGARAQVYFNYKTDALVNEVLNEADRTITLDDHVFDNYNAAKSGQVTGLNYYGTSVVLTSATKITHYFTVDPTATLSDYTFKVNDVEVTPVARDGYCYVDIENVMAKNLDKDYKLVVTKGNESFEITYSVFDYAHIVCGGEQYAKELKDVVKAMYVYNSAAKAYAQQ